MKFLPSPRRPWQTAVLTHALLLLASTTTIVVVDAIPDGFEDAQVVDIDRRGSGGVTDLAFTPDGKHLLLTMKVGWVDAYENFESRSNPDDPPTRTILNLKDRLCVNSERGLGSVTVHPDFADNGFLYVFYTFNKFGNCNPEFDVSETNPVNRLSRFVWTGAGKGGVVDVESERVLLETPPLPDKMHNAGDMAFGKDGHLYVTIGDAGSGTKTYASQNAGNLFGTIVRLTDDGHIPPTNPFANGPRCHNGTDLTANDDKSDDDETCAEIVALGLRNPWRFAMDPNTRGTDVRYFINDVGSGKWEEINEGGHSSFGANYGYPDREGPCEKGSYEDCERDSRFVDPVHYYPHDEEGHAAVTAGAFVPNGLWPPEYDGAYLYADYTFGNIYVMMEGDDVDGCPECTPPESKYEIEVLVEYDKVISMVFGPYKDGKSQALYYVTRKDEDEVRRVSYVGDGSNFLPTANLTTSSTYVPVGGSVTFDASRSFDPDGHNLTYAWDFDDDGSVDSWRVRTTRTFDEEGLFKATLTVSDGRGGHAFASAEISVGTKPIPVIEIPPAGTTFASGDVFTLRGSASDAEDGILDDASLTWEVRQHHGNHYHPFLDLVPGNDVTISPAPVPEDIEAATNSYLEILLTATDSKGLSDTVSRFVMPRKVRLSFETTPVPLELKLDGYVIRTPANITAWEGQQMRFEAHGQYYDSPDGTGRTYYASSCWSDGGEPTHSVAIKPGMDDARFVARFSRIANPKPSVLLGRSQVVRSTETAVSDPPGYYLSQRLDGELDLHRGAPGSSLGVLWSSNSRQTTEGDHFAKLQGDGNFVVSRGTPSEQGGTVWKSGVTDGNGKYFLEFRPLESKLAVYRGEPDDRGDALWETETLSVVSSTGAAECEPGEPSESPTLPPTTSPTLFPSAPPTPSPDASVGDAPSPTPPAPTPPAVPRSSPTAPPTAGPTRSPNAAPAAAPTSPGGGGVEPPFATAARTTDSSGDDDGRAFVSPPRRWIRTAVLVAATTAGVLLLEF